MKTAIFPPPQRCPSYSNKQSMKDSNLAEWLPNQCHHILYVLTSCAVLAKYPHCRPMNPATEQFISSYIPLNHNVATEVQRHKTTVVSSYHFLENAKRYGQKDAILKRLDWRECVEEFANDNWTQLFEALCCLADEHQDIGGCQLILITQELNQLHRYMQIR